MTARQLRLGEQLRDEGIARVLENDPGWAEYARIAVERLAAEGRPFTAEDVRELVGDPPHGNAMGAVIRNAAKAGTNRKVGFTPATRPSLHATELAQWEGAR